MESTKTFVEHPSGKLAVTVHAPRSLREEEAAYFHGINLEQAHKFAHLNGWQLTVDREKDDTVSAADADSFKIGDATIDGVGGKGQQAVRIEAKVGVSDGAEKTDVPIPTEKDIKRNLLWGIGCTSFGLFCFVVGLFASFFCVIIGLVFIVLGVGSLSLYRSGKKDRQLAETDFEAYKAVVAKRSAQKEAVERWKAERAAADEEKKRRRANEPVSCPKCGSTSIATVNRGYSLMWGIYGSGSPRNVCQKCGYRFKPGSKLFKMERGLQLRAAALFFYPIFQPLA